jgi:RimJ/RimL family protein N-acetyltransferase
VRHDIVLEGYGVRLRPLATDDAAALAALADRELWSYMPPPFPDGVDGWVANIEDALATHERMALCVTDARSGAVLGSSSFYDRSDLHRRVEVGYTFYGRASWGSRINPACKRLMLGEAFEAWGLSRVALRCDADNARSAAAIQKLGAKAEGRLRNHRRRPDGTQGDTLYFSVIDSEWPDVRSALDARLRA